MLLLPLLLPVLTLVKTTTVFGYLSHRQPISVDDSTVTLDYGKFTGAVDTVNGIISYLGIRYADAPIGDLRWKAPVSPPTTHLGHVNATKFGAACITTKQTTIVSRSEDCLFGNVYVPIIKTSYAKLPVLVWFHGGGFQSGTTHTPSPMPIIQAAAGSMIFVSFEYRLGQFGFLGGTQVKENGVLNAGLLDQRAALRWVQRYIAHFGGDNKRVTIWGQSAGAGSTMFHLLGNGGNNDGLFNAAMGDSPSLNFLPSFNDPYVEAIFDQFSTLAGCGGERDAMACLRSKNSSVLTIAGSQTIFARADTLFTFAPIIDGTFLQERPVEAFGNGHFARVPVVFGSNTDDGAHWSAMLRDGSANTSMPNATETTVYNFLRGQWASFTRPSFDKAVSLYPLADYDNSFSLQGQQMYGEMRYMCTAALITGAVGKKLMKGYHFHYHNPHLGSFHGDELAAFFEDSVDANEADNMLFTAMRQFWTTFVVNGTPVAENETAWKPVTDATGSPYMLLQPGELVVGDISGAQAARCGFWHSISTELDM